MLMIYLAIMGYLCALIAIIVHYDRGPLTGTISQSFFFSNIAILAWAFFIANAASLNNFIKFIDENGVFHSIWGLTAFLSFILTMIYSSIIMSRRAIVYEHWTSHIKLSSILYSFIYWPILILVITPLPEEGIPIEVAGGSMLFIIVRKCFIYLFSSQC